MGEEDISQKKDVGRRSCLQRIAGEKRAKEDRGGGGEREEILAGSLYDLTNKVWSVIVTETHESLCSASPGSGREEEPNKDKEIRLSRCGAPEKHSRSPAKITRQEGGGSKKEIKKRIDTLKPSVPLRKM